MKKVWIINHYALEPGTAGGTRHFQLAKDIRAHGWLGVVIASSVELNSGRQRLSDGEAHRLQDHGGVPFLWIRVPAYRGNGSGRMANMLLFAWRVLKPSSTRGLPLPDVVVGSSVHPFAAAAGALLAKRFRVPFVFEVRDLWPRTLIDLGRIKAGGATARVMAWLELWLYRKAKAIIVLLPLAGDYISGLGIERSKVTWIPNGVDLAMYPARVPPHPIAAGGAFTLMYFGAHGQANALGTVIEAVALIHARDPTSRVRLRMIGDGPMKEELVSLARALGLAEGVVMFEPPVPKRDIPRLAAEADAFVLSVLDRPALYRYGISMNKLFDYLAAGRPVILASAAVNDPVREAGCGVTVPPEDPVRLSEAIVHLTLLSDEELRVMGLKGRKHVEENYGFERLAAKFARVLDQSAETTSLHTP